MIPLALIGLIVVPFGAFVWAKRQRPESVGVITGASFGLVVAPVSLGLYATYFLGPLGIVTGMIGLLSGMFHGAPGYYISTFVGIVPERTVVEGVGRFYVEAVNGIFWALIYGALGWVVDYARKRKVAL